MAVKNRSVIVRSFSEIWEDGYFDSGTPSDTIKPGTLLAQYSGGLTIGSGPQELPKYRVSGDVNNAPVIVFEDDIHGKTIDDDIAVGDYIRVKFLNVGERYVVYSKASDEVAVGNYLNPHTDGTVVLHNTSGASISDTAMTIFRAETAVGTAATGADRRLVVRVVRV
jgi:hypothetical protein